MFSHVSVHPSIILSVHTPIRTSYMAVGMPLAFTEEDFLVSVVVTGISLTFCPLYFLQLNFYLLNTMSVWLDYSKEQLKVPLFFLLI